MIVRTLKTAENYPLFTSTQSRQIVKPDDDVGYVIFDSTLAAGAFEKIADEVASSYSSQAHYCLSGEGRAFVNGQEYNMTSGGMLATSLSREIVFESGHDMRICTILSGEVVTDQIIYRRLDDIIGTERDVFWGNGRSRRLLVKGDGLGFALCVTQGNANTDSALQYRNHFESCYYVSGSGEYVWEDGSHPIDTTESLSTVFIMNRNDAHRMVVRDESICLSVFSPPIEGHEKHDLSGRTASSY